MYASVMLIKETKMLDRLFTYLIPEHLLGLVQPGSKVLIPFGAGDSTLEGIVSVIQSDTDLPSSKIKAIRSVVAEEPWLNEEALQLAYWIRERYVCTYTEALSLFLPAGTKLKKRLIESKDTNGQYIKLEELYTDIEDQEMAYIQLKISPGAIRSAIGALNTRSIVKRAVLEYLLKYGRVPEPVLRKETKATGAIIEGFIDLGYIERDFEEHLTLPEHFEFETPPNSTFVGLTEEQQKAFDPVASVMTQEVYKPFLLKGVTGSGKTEVYMEWVDLALQMGKQAMILVPEISLTPQIIDRFKQRFGNSIAVFHSKMSNRKRYDQWKAVRQGKLNIIIGARSGLFAPVKRLGVVIVDEEHDGSYKSDTAPKYSGVEVAETLARIHQAPLILGSATPSISSYHRVVKGEMTCLEMTKRYRETPMPSVDVIDMREELALGNRSIFSHKLAQEMTKTLRSGKQVMLLMNRKGFSTFVSCRTCGYVMKCPDCEITLTYHKGHEHLRCSYCQYRIELPSQCPSCSSPYFKHFGTGTEKVEELTKEAFPNYVVDRLDSETVSKLGQLEQILERFGKGETQILIGTQMISKGLNFKNVGLVGVISADMTLNLPDFQSSEKAFQLLTQVAGRSGRGEERGHVVIQTYDPDHFAIQSARHHSFLSFYNQEIRIREAFKYPPYFQIANILLSSPSEIEVQKAANSLYRKLYDAIKGSFGLVDIEISNPNPALYAKIKNRYRWQIIIKYKEESSLSLMGMIRHHCFESFDKKQYTEQLRITVDARAQNIL